MPGASDHPAARRRVGQGTPIIRTEQEIEDAAMRAQRAAFAAEDDEGRDDAADAIYTFWQWMTGLGSDDPTAEMDEGLEP